MQGSPEAAGSGNGKAACADAGGAGGAGAGGVSPVPCSQGRKPLSDPSGRRVCARLVPALIFAPRSSAGRKPRQRSMKATQKRDPYHIEGKNQIAGRFVLIFFTPRGFSFFLCLLRS